MTAWILTAVLAWLCLVLTLLLAGRCRGANRAEARLQKAADDLAAKYATERAKVSHLQRRNAELRDELDAGQPCDTSLTAEWLTFINQWPVLEDPR